MIFLWFESDITKLVFKVMLVVRGRFYQNFYSDNMGNKFATFFSFSLNFLFDDEGGEEYMLLNL